MNGTRKLLRKVTAAASASALLVSGASSVAAASYQEAEKASLTQLITDFSAYWDQVMASMEQSATGGGKAVMTLKLEDGGKTLLSAASGGMDFSWLNTLTMDMTASVAEGKETANAAILMNDSPLCNMNIYMDMADMTEYLQIPELSESWLKIPLLASMELSAEEAAAAFETEEEAQAYQEYMEQYEASMNNSFKVLGDMTSVLPDTKTLSTLLERYGNLIIDNTGEGTSTEEALSVEGVSEDCTVYETTITEENLTTMLNTILTTAKEDKELKSILEMWDEAGGTDLSTQFQTGIDGLLSDLAAEEASGEDVISSKIWTNAEGKIRGREISLESEGQSYPIFSWKSPSADGNSALLVEFGADTSSITFTGSGQSADGLLSGDYVLAVDGVKLIGISAENLETNPEVPGYYNGTFNVSVLDQGTEEEPNPLAAFGLTVKLASDAKAQTNQIDMTVTNSGASLVTLSVGGSYAEEGVAAPDQAALDSAVDMSSEEGAQAYAEGLDLNTLLTNAVAAGMPEELATALVQSMQPAASSTEGEIQETAPEEEAPAENAA